MDMLADVPFAFDRKRVYTDRKALLRDLARLLAKTKGGRLKIDTLSVGSARGTHGPWQEQRDLPFVP